VPDGYRTFSPDVVYPLKGNTCYRPNPLMWSPVQTPFTGGGGCFDYLVQRARMKLAHSSKEK